MSNEHNDHENDSSEFSESDLQRLSERVKALPGEIAPNANAWENIQRRIEASRVRELPTSFQESTAEAVVPFASDAGARAADDFRARRLQSQRRTRIVMLAAASLFITVTSVVVLRERNDAGANTSTPDSASATPTIASVSPETAATVVAASSTIDSATRTIDRALEAPVAAVIAQYSSASDDMTKDFDARRSRLQPEALAVVDSALHTLDQAIRESKDALRESPKNATIIELLQVTYQQKIDLLRRSADLPTVSLQD